MQHFVEDMDMEWNNFVASIDKVSERLLGPFNVVMVVEPINIKISEAIMNFQERNKEISGQVFQGCGRPILGKRKRSVDDDFMFFDGEEEGDVAVPVENRVRRNADPESNTEIRDFEPMRFSGENYGNTDGGRGTNNGANGGGGRGGRNRGRGNKNRGMDYDMAKEPTLDKLIKDIRQKVKDTKKFWANLPFQFCNHEDLVAPSTSSGSHQLCWNGQNPIR